MKKNSNGNLTIIVCLLIGVFLVLIYHFRLNFYDIGPQTQISALVLPHHDLAASQRKSMLESLQNSVSPKTIILISPNHFNSSLADFATTTKTWQLLNSNIYANNDVITKITSDGLVKNDESSFDLEHGITNLLDPINSVFPQAKIVPIIIRQDTPRDKVILLEQSLENACTDHCLLIASVDFSHYNPAALAEIHDNLSITALNNLDEDLAWKAEVDSPQSLLLLVRWAKDHQTNKFNLFLNTNSGYLTHDLDNETTSYVLGWFGSGQPNKKDNSDITFLIGGDMMFGRNINYHFQNNDIYKLTDQLGNRVFWGTDLAMVNLEGPISATPIPADNSKDEMIFNFPPHTAQILNYLHINAVSLANNHSNNQGASGFINTQNVLKKENILPVGQENIFNESNAVARFNRGNMKLSVITINALEVKTDITALIKKEKETGAKVIIFPHWGTEYEPTHSASQQTLAHAWIDAGADMVIGSHPHVIQDIEIYKNKPVFYSLGNLLFDQNFSPETQTGLMVAGKFSDNQLSLVLLPTQIVNFKPSLLMGAPRAEMIQRLTQELPQNNVNIKVNYDKIELDN